MTNNPFTKNQSCISRFFLLMSLTCVSFVSCESDKDENADAPKRLARIVSEYIDTDGVGKNCGNVSFSYDSEGRVVSFVNNIQDNNYSDFIESRYQYGDNYIFNEEIEDVNTGYSQWLSIERHKYSIENGLIVTDSTIRNNGSNMRVLTYTYDDEKRLVAITTKINGRSAYTTEFVWEDGNLIEMKEGSDTFSYDYTTLPWKKGIATNFGFELDAFLWDAGYFGKRSKNLPYGYWYSGNYNSYGYGFSNGLVSEIIERYETNDGSVYKFVSTLLWE